MHLHSYLDQFPLIGIFRGLKPDEALAVADPVLEAGFQILEIPMNSPQPLQSIELLAKRFPDQIVGGGTVMSPDDVKRIAAVGGRLIFMPHSDPAVIRQAKLSGLLCIAGVATPTGAFAALANGADALKLYPAEQLAPVVVKAWRAVVPSQHRLLPVGGITPQSMKPYLLADRKSTRLELQSLMRSSYAVLCLKKKSKLTK